MLLSQFPSWIHAVSGAVAVVSCNPKRLQNRPCLPPSWTTEELDKNVLPAFASLVECSFCFINNVRHGAAGQPWQLK